MEYEKHIKRLVLGFLKNECKSAYKVFLKSNFQSQHKHIATRVAGQTLEDILRIYSRIQDIVQGHLEDTDYYKENYADVSSPLYLAEQLLYLLERNRPFTPVSTICDRSPGASSIAESNHGNKEDVGNSSDVETTPEHTLPGNVSSCHDNCHLRTPLCRKSPVFRTPYNQNLPSTEHDNISSVLSIKLLEKKQFHKKLARNITTALNTPEILSLSRREHDVNKKTLPSEFEDTIQDALTRTEADPMFEDLLQDFFDPVANTLGKAITADAASSSSRPNVGDHNEGAVSSILAVSNVTNIQSDNQDPSTINATLSVPSEQIGDKTTTSSEQIGDKATTSSEQVEGIQQNASASVQTQQILHTPPGIYTVPSAISQSGSQQQQQFYIVNQPVMIPQPGQIMQLIQPVQMKGSNKKKIPRANAKLTGDDIMSMPTIFLNERNEITYAEPINLVENTAYKVNEVRDIKEYFKIYGSTDQSPVIKKQSQPAIKPTPTIKVEIFQRDTPCKIVEDAQAKSPENISNTIKELPNLDDTVVSTNTSNKDFSDDRSKDTSNKETSKSTINEDKSVSIDEVSSKTLGSVCTPSPIVKNTRKPTPKSSSHVRNLSFPSPLRKVSGEKTDGNQNSPSTLNKQQATKNLFKKKSEKAKSTIQSNKSPRTRSKGGTEAKESELQKLKSPRKVSSPKKASSKRQNTPKTLTKPTKRNIKNGVKETIENKTTESWDTALRKNLPSDESHLTPRRTSSKNRTRREPEPELDISDTDGKKLEDALKTPGKSEPTKGKTPSKKRQTKKPEKKSVQAEDEPKVEPKKILSPSKLCNTASKRNMEVDGITPSNSQEGSNQPVSNARKNITPFLLETPLKEDEISSPALTPLGPTNTPFTPMLKANLEGFTVGDTFSIDTPNFPVTPGLALMEHSSTAYYILNDTETNKATEAIVLSEERKSSVRKTDDEDIEMSPKVYGCKEILDEFNKSRAGMKNLELLDNRGVNWDGSSGKDDKSDNSDSNSDDESNSTVIKKANLPGANNAPRSARIAGKSMSRMKSQLLDKNTYPELSNTNEKAKLEPRDHVNQSQTSETIINNLKSKKLKDASSSSDSEIILKESHTNKRSNEENENEKKDKNKKPNGEMENSGEAKETKENPNVNPVLDKETLNQHCLRENSIIGISSITVETIKQTVSNISLKRLANPVTTAFSVKAEMDAKRRRVIELEKTQESRAVKTPSRRRTVKPQIKKVNSPTNKRKRSAPKKMLKNVDNHDEQLEPGDTNNDYEKVVSQDDFFKKSGSNLHRTKNHSIVENLSDTSLDLGDKEAATKIISINEVKSESVQKCESSCENSSKDEVTGNLVSPSLHHVGPSEGQKSLEEPNRSNDNELDNEDGSFWDECDFQLQPDEKIIVYVEANTSKKCLGDYNLNLKTKGFQMAVPLADGSVQPVEIVVSPFRILWEIKPSKNNDNEDDVSTLSSNNAVLRPTPDCSSDSEIAECKVADPDEQKCAKKRKHRSDSCNSNLSLKKMKTSLLNENNIEKLLTTIHGPSEKT